MTKFVKAVRSTDGTSRLVFDLGDEQYGVVKNVTDTVTSVKVWNLSDSTLSKTMSFWKTKEEFEPSDTMVVKAIDALRAAAGALTRATLG